MGATQSNLMDKKRKAKGRPSEGSQAFKGFINIPLTDPDKERIKTILEEADTIESTLLELTSEGYKISLREDTTSGSYSASATAVTPDHANAGYALTAYGPDIQGAVIALAYKILTLCEGGSWESAQSVLAPTDKWK